MQEKTYTASTDEANEGWLCSRSDIFWGEIAPCDHVLQIYESDQVFVDALAGFVGGGINAGDCMIVIATSIHLKALEERLTSLGVHIDSLILTERYVPLVAEDVLSQFMVNGWPDEKLFMETVGTIIQKAVRHGHRIRAFGEMVAILWAKGQAGATVQLEHLWNKFCEKQSFCLFCAYPRVGFTQDINDSLAHICSSHSKMISGTERSMTEVFYKAVG